LQCGHLKPRWRSVCPAISSAVKVFLQCGQTTSCPASAAGRSATLSTVPTSRPLGQEEAIVGERRPLAGCRIASRHAEMDQPEEALAVRQPDRETTGLRPQHGRRPPVASSCTRSPLKAADATISVGARSSFVPSAGPAASFSRSRVSGPRTRKRQGFVRWWFGAQRASSSSASSVSRGTGSEPNDLCVLRERMTSSTGLPETDVKTP